MKTLSTYRLVFFIGLFSQTSNWPNTIMIKAILKAKIGFEELLSKCPSKHAIFLRTIDCYQQLEQYDVAEKQFNPVWTNTIKKRFG
jgi:hypothetical protein